MDPDITFDFSDNKKKEYLRTILLHFFEETTINKEYKEEFKYTKLKKFWSVAFIYAKTILRSIIVLPITFPLFPIIIVIFAAMALFCFFV